MKTSRSTRSLLFVMGAIAGYAHGQSPPATAPLPGQWDITVTSEGMPFGGGAKAGKACLTADSLQSGHEAAMIAAAMKLAQPETASKTSTPSCSFSDVSRQGSDSRWKSTCAGPRGAMAGSGSGSFKSDSATLSQAFEVSLPFGKRTITQTISAKRIGECA